MDGRKLSRQSIILQLAALVKETRKQGKEISYSNFLDYVMTTFFVSERTAKEYINCALLKNNLKADANNKIRPLAGKGIKNERQYLLTER